MFDTKKSKINEWLDLEKQLLQKYNVKVDELLNMIKKAEESYQRKLKAIQKFCDNNFLKVLEKDTGSQNSTQENLQIMQGFFGKMSLLAYNQILSKTEQLEFFDKEITNRSQNLIHLFKNSKDSISSCLNLVKFEDDIMPAIYHFTQFKTTKFDMYMKTLDFISDLYKVDTKKLIKPKNYDEARKLELKNETQILSKQLDLNSSKDLPVPDCLINEFEKLEHIMDRVLSQENQVPLTKSTYVNDSFIYSNGVVDFTAILYEYLDAFNKIVQEKSYEPDLKPKIKKFLSGLLIKLTNEIRKRFVEIIHSDTAKEFKSLKKSDLQTSKIIVKKINPPDEKYYLEIMQKIDKGRIIMGNLRFLREEFLGQRYSDWTWKQSETLAHKEIDEICWVIDDNINLIIKDLANFMYQKISYLYVINNLYYGSINYVPKEKYSLKNIMDDIDDKIMTKFNQGYNQTDAEKIKSYHILICFSGFAKKVIELIKYKKCNNEKWKSIFLNDQQYIQDYIEKNYKISMKNEENCEILRQIIENLVVKKVSVITINDINVRY